MELLLIIIVGLFLYFVLRPQKVHPNHHSQKFVNFRRKDYGQRTHKRNNSILAEYDEDESLATFSISYGYEEEKSKNNAPGKWIKTGEVINVKGLQITEGKFYFGGQLPSLDGYGIEASLVDDSLKTVNQPITYEDGSLGYWPKFISISPHCRGAYLNWLASNRNNPETPLGYVFIYFYGLERRIVVDALQNGIDDYECRAIFSELIRLKEVYGKSRSFLNYSTRLLEIMCLLFPDVVSHPELENNPKRDSILLKYRLAKTVHDGKPVHADLALAWLKFYPNYNLKKPARRCSQEFDKMFTRQYVKKYGEGIIVKPNRTRLRLGYYPASPTLRGVSISQEDLPDPSNLKGPATKLIAIAENCTKALDSYSRYIGKNDTSRSDISAVLLLPEELNDLEAFHRLNEFKKWADENISKQNGLIDVEEFWEFTELPLPDKINKKETDLIELLAEKAGFGIVPDSRYHHAKPFANGKLVLFKGGHGKDFEPSIEFNKVGMVLRLGAMLATINSHVDQTQTTLLKQLIDQNTKLSPIEKRSMHSYLVWRLNTRSNLTGLKARLMKLGVKEKAAVSQILIGVALADGKIEPEEIRQLEKLYSLLGLDKSLVTGDIHKMTIGKASTQVNDQTSEQFKEVSKGFRLNEKVLAIHESQTKDVQKMLDTIFVDNEPDNEIDSEVEDQVIQEDIGLDTIHYSLYENLINKDRWSFEEIDELCKKMGLMTNGAIETINEWSFERVDAPVLDEEADAVYVDQKIVEELEK